VTADAWITLAVVVFTVALLASERVPPAPAMLGAVVVLFVLDVIPAEQAFAGFANEAPIIVAALYVLAGAAEATGAMGVLATWLGRDRGERRNLSRLLGVTSLMSAVVNNTTVVAAVAPPIVDWARRQRLSASRYLMPCSFAALLGGLLTAIGTSTNITVSGLLTDAGMDPIGFFEITRVGLPIAIVGLAVMVLTTSRLLPARTDVFADVAEDMREFTVEMRVVPGGPLVGKSVEDAGLRHLQGVFLVEIERDGRVIAPVAPDEILEAGDSLVFAGNVDMVLDLQRIRGLASAERHHFDLGAGGREQRFWEAVIGQDSPLAGTTLKRVGFRARYGAAVVAIHRAGERLRAKLGEVQLRPGDVLLVLAGSNFRQQWRGRRDFLMISGLGGTNPNRSSRAWIVYVVGLFVIVFAGLEILPLLKVALIAALAFILLGVLSVSEARAAIDVNVIVLIAASYGLGAAVQSSGLAETIAGGLVSTFDTFGATGTLLGIFLATTVLTALISNNAAAVLMFPIGLASAARLGVDPRAFVIAIAVAASTDFLTPVGYQTNTMVMGIGGYKFTDFTRVGFPLTITTVLVAVAVIPIFWPF
jgi:di/tricarboxylate transporter